MKFADHHCSASNHVVLLRTCAVRIVNLKTGKSTLAYAQHQATLISEDLSNEFELETRTDSKATIRTLSDQTATIKGRTDFEIKSLFKGENFMIENAFVVLKFNDDENVLSHAVDITGLEHFMEINIHIISKR